MLNFMAESFGFNWREGPAAIGQNRVWTRFEKKNAHLDAENAANRRCLELTERSSERKTKKREKTQRKTHFQRSCAKCACAEKERVGSERGAQVSAARMRSSTA